MNSTARRLAALFVFAIVALLSPAIGALNAMQPVLGYPPLVLALFVVWAGLLVAAYFVVRRRR
jgi:purine-cytosine permease-like protein